jgi:hypothetical protein
VVYQDDDVGDNATDLLIVLNIVGAKVEKVFVSFLDDGRCPDGVASP